MSINDNKKIFEQMYRMRLGDYDYSFEHILKLCILEVLTDDLSKAELLAGNKVRQLWNYYCKEHNEDVKNGIVPLFTIENEYDKIVHWIGDTSEYGTRREQYLVRPDLYKFFDKLDDRQYEIMACVICELLGADRIYLTPKGNEGGIDFLARIPFSNKAHFLFGIKGPIRIVGQCKKYTSKDNVGHMKEFVQTLGSVYNKSFRAGEILPDWFKIERGTIIGWHISNLGHQSGALDIAKNYGILVSDSKQLIDIICRSKVVRNQKNVISFLEERLTEDNVTYPLLTDTLRQTLIYYHVRMKVEKKLMEVFHIIAGVNDVLLLNQIIQRAFSCNNPNDSEYEYKRACRVFFTSRKTLLNEFNYFEGNMNIFQPAIDITVTKLQKEIDTIENKLIEIENRYKEEN